jgi:hypothetical protein
MTATDGAALRHLLAAAAKARGEPVASASEASAAASALLAAQVGAEVASALSSALERVDLLLRSGRIGQHSLRALHEEVGRARRVAMLGQQVSRLAAGRVRQVPESLELPQMLRDAVGQRADEIAARGIEVRQLLAPASVSVDASLLFSLLLNLIDWALEHGRAQALTLTTGLNPWPVHAVLHCDFVWRAPDRLGPDADLAFEAERLERTERGDPGSDLDTMAWRLVEQACAAMRVRIERQDSPCQVHLTLAFAEVPRRLPGLNDLPSDEGGTLADRPLQGCRALVLGTRPESCGALADAVAQQGLTVEMAEDLDEARTLAQAAPLDLVVVDDRNREIDRLLAEFKAGGSGPALVHVCHGLTGLEIRTSGRFEVVRVGADRLRQDLPAALRYAIGAG